MISQHNDVATAATLSKIFCGEPMLKTSLSVKKGGNCTLFFWGHEECETSAFATSHN